MEADYAGCLVNGASREAKQVGKVLHASLPLMKIRIPTKLIKFPFMIIFFSLTMPGVSIKYKFFISFTNVAENMINQFHGGNFYDARSIDN